MLIPGVAREKPPTGAPPHSAIFLWQDANTDGAQEKVEACPRETLVSRPLSGEGTCHTGKPFQTITRGGNRPGLYLSDDTLAGILLCWRCLDGLGGCPALCPDMLSLWMPWTPLLPSFWLTGQQDVSTANESREGPVGAGRREEVRPHSLRWSSSGSCSETPTITKHWGRRSCPSAFRPAVPMNFLSLLLS